MYKIGVIGDRESVLGFKAVGLTVFSCDSQEEADAAFRETTAGRLRHNLYNGALL